MIIKLYIKQKLGYGCTKIKIKSIWCTELNINDFIFIKVRTKIFNVIRVLMLLLLFIIQYLQIL